MGSGRCAFGLIILTLLSPWVSAEPPIEQRQLLNGVLWMQKALEYRITTEMLYRMATEKLPQAINQLETAALEQQAVNNYQSLPPAIILDLDETVLDNAAFNGWQVATGTPYDGKHWNQWLAEAAAEAIPGALAFTKEAVRQGVTLFYVTNRACITAEDCPAKRQTMTNMAQLGFPRAEDPSAFLLKQEQPEWFDDKSSRRLFIARTHRIVMVIGDDLQDFLPSTKVNQYRESSTDAPLEQWAKLFGHRWFLLPNPVYGSWERHLPPSLEAKYAGLSVADLPCPISEPTVGEQDNDPGD